MIDLESEIRVRINALHDRFRGLEHDWVKSDASSVDTLIELASGLGACWELARLAEEFEMHDAFAYVNTVIDEYTGLTKDVDEDVQVFYKRGKKGK